MSEQLLKVIEYLYSMNIQKASVVASKTPDVESQRHTMAFLWLGKH